MQSTTKTWGSTVSSPAPVTTQNADSCPYRAPIELVLTGGACSGKTTALGAIAHELRTRRVHVLAVPEAFTLLVSGGINGVGDMVRADGMSNCDFQATLFRRIRSMRSQARLMAQEMCRDSAIEGPIVILFDRGELDALAFHDHGCFDALAAEEGTTVATIRDSYTVVMHLITTANGAEDFYSSMTNPARWERPEEARASDVRLGHAWDGHPNRHFFDNSTDFAGKLARIMATLDPLIAAYPLPTLAAAGVGQ